MEYKRLENTKKKIISLILILLTVIVVAAFSITHKSSRYINVEVVGRSMEPTLHSGEKLTANNDTSSIKRGDIIIFKSQQEGEEGKILIKRVIGMPNEKIRIENEKVLINDKIISEPYIKEKMNSTVDKTQPIDFIIPPDSYYVMGDNRNNSNDSRSFGAVPIKAILGKINSTK